MTILVGLGIFVTPVACSYLVVKCFKTFSFVLKLNWPQSKTKKSGFLPKFFFFFSWVKKTSYKKCPQGQWFFLEHKTKLHVWGILLPNNYTYITCLDNSKTVLLSLKGMLCSISRKPSKNVNQARKSLKKNLTNAKILIYLFSKE